jgi:hypothetical protein
LANSNRRPPRQPRPRGTAPNILTWTRTRRTLAELGVDEKRFIHVYETLPSTRAPRDLDEALLHAGERFVKDGDFGAFKRAIKSNNDQQANARLGRYFRYRTRNGHPQPTT